MGNLIDDRPLTGGGKTTIKLISNETLEIFGD